MEVVLLIVARFAVMSCWLVGRLGEVRSSLIPDCVLAAALNSMIASFFPIISRFVNRVVRCRKCSYRKPCDLSLR